MSEQTAPARGRLREHAAEEIRVLLARKRMSAAELARRTGIKNSTMSRRMTGETAFDLDDLEAIADALGVEVTELLPRQKEDGQPNVRLSQVSRTAEAKTAAARAHPPTGRTSPHVAAGGSPSAPQRRDSTRPQSAVPVTRRRPVPVKPPTRPMAA